MEKFNKLKHLNSGALILSSISLTTLGAVGLCSSLVSALTTNSVYLYPTLILPSAFAICAGSYLGIKSTKSIEDEFSK